MCVEVDSIESRTRPLRFSLARVELASRGGCRAAMSAICSTAIASALGEVVLARADVDADLAGVGVLRRGSCRRRRPCRASRGSPGRGATRRSRRGSRRGSRRRSAGGRSARRRARRGRRGTARCPCAGSAGPASACARAAAARAACRRRLARAARSTAGRARPAGRGRCCRRPRRRCSPGVYIARW